MLSQAEYLPPFTYQFHFASDPPTSTQIAALWVLLAITALLYFVVFMLWRRERRRER